MSRLQKIEVSVGIFWVEVAEANVRILCGCPADSVKHLMKRGLIAPTESNKVTFETGPNAILLSDVMIQNGVFANMAEFPVLQMLYRQGMIIPNHPGNKGQKPLLLGSPAQVKAQINYIHRGNYGLISEEELLSANVNPIEAHEMMRIKLKFAFGAIRNPTELVDTLELESAPVEIRNGVEIQRLKINVFEIRYKDDVVVVDLNLPDNETYECPYPLGYHYIPREYFSVIHSGEGDGWDINRPSMGTVLMFQGRIYLIDAGPNIVASLSALGVGVNEIEGIFQTHSHDDHFAGLTTLFRSDHRLKYFATPMVRAAVAKKMAALLDLHEGVFSDYFDVHDLVADRWNDVDGLEVRPVYSPHPVETTIFFFRAMWVDGYRSYAHLADIVSFDVLRGFITLDDGAPGINEERFRRTIEDYSVPADIKKIDIGGGMIHGDALDFRSDVSAKIILAHTSQKHTIKQRSIGSAAAFGTVDTLIPTDHDFIWRSAFEILRASFPDVSENQIRVLMNNEMMAFNPGTILLREGHVTKEIWIIMSGSVEVVHAGGLVRSVLSSGAIVGELNGLFGSPASETYRSQGFVKALKLPASLYSKFVRRNNLLEDITQLSDRREFLQHTWLFGEVVSTKAINLIARECLVRHFDKGEPIEISPQMMGIIKKGQMIRLFDGKEVSRLNVGDFFGEDRSVFWDPSPTTLETAEKTEALLLPASVVATIPSVRWRLFEEWGRRVNHHIESSIYTNRA
jgi:hemerythrin